MADWAAFFQTAASASATLIGLVVVAISINLTRILAFAHLPARAAAAFAPLTGVLVLSLLGLAPSGSPVLFGAGAFGVGTVVWLIGMTRLVRGRQAGVEVPPLRFWSSLLLDQLQSLPFVVSGVLLMLGEVGAVSWIVPGVIFSLLSGLANTWVLLVEILR